MSEISIGMVGFGYWGSKLARNVATCRDARLALVAEGDPDRRRAAIEAHPGARGVADLHDVLASDVDAVVLATPASLHAAHARDVLEAGKHVMVEKPLALSVADCEELTELARDRGLTLMVGHTFLYSEPVRMLRRLVAEGELGDILYIYGARLNLGMIRDDLNAWWNFGPHDVSILLHLLQEPPLRVSARQFRLLQRRLEDVAFVVIEFGSGAVGHVHDSWLDPRKVRQFTVVGTRKMAVYDDTDAETPIRIYDKGVDREGEGSDYGAFKLELRTGDMLAPHVRAREPLAVEIEHFVECVRTGSTPLTDGNHARDVVAVLEAADRSTRDGGRVVEVATEVTGAHPAA